MMREAIAFIGIMLATIGTIFVGIAALANWGNSVNCRDTAAIMGLEHHYSFTTPCMVKVDGRWEPLNYQRSVRIKEAN